MSFPFTPTAPASSQPPRLSQPIMQQNFNSIFNILPVDHIGFGNSTGGQHKQTTFPNFVAPSDPTGTTTIAFPNAGIADPTNGQYYFINQNATFPLSMVKAMGVFAPATGVIPLLNGYNIVSISGSGSTLSRTYIITLKTNCCFGNNVIVLKTANIENVVTRFTYTFANPTLTFTFTAVDASTPLPATLISFAVLQI